MATHFYCRLEKPILVSDLIYRIRRYAIELLGDSSWSTRSIQCYSGETEQLLADNIEIGGKSFLVKVSLIGHWIISISRSIYSKTKIILLKCSNCETDDQVFWATIVSAAVAECTDCLYIDGDVAIPDELSRFMLSEDEVDLHRLEDVMEWFRGEGGLPYITAAKEVIQKLDQGYDFSKDDG